jgi:3-hydroxyacyl-[acyl-carrier-protein] dehydratase
LNSLDIREVRKYLPHRFPFLMIDRVLEYEPDKRLVAIKNVTINEPYFQGHFPSIPVMPGVMIIETMAQACAILSMVTLNVVPNEESIYYFLGIDKARFKRAVSAGDQLRLEATIKRKLKGVWQFEAVATVDGEICCTADLMCTYKGIGAPE